MIAKTKRNEAERAAEWALIDQYYCTHTVRAIKSKFQRQDLFASDVIGKDKNGEMVFCQVTTGKKEAVRQRKKKMEAIQWQETDIILLFQMDFEQKEKSKEWFFKVFEYILIGYGLSWKREWTDRPTIHIEKEWFKAYKR